MGTAIKHPVPDRVKQSFVIFDIWPTLMLSPDSQSARMSKITNDCLTRSGTGCFKLYPYGNSELQGVKSQQYHRSQIGQWASARCNRHYSCKPHAQCHGPPKHGRHSAYKASHDGSCVQRIPLPRPSSTVSRQTTRILVQCTITNHSIRN